MGQSVRVMDERFMTAVVTAGLFAAGVSSGSETTSVMGKGDGPECEGDGSECEGDG